MNGWLHLAFIVLFSEVLYTHCTAISAGKVCCLCCANSYLRSSSLCL